MTSGNAYQNKDLQREVNDLLGKLGETAKYNIEGLIKSPEDHAGNY